MIGKISGRSFAQQEFHDSHLEKDMHSECDSSTSGICAKISWYGIRSIRHAEPNPLSRVYRPPYRVETHLVAHA